MAHRILSAEAGPPPPVHAAAGRLVGGDEPIASARWSAGGTADPTTQRSKIQPGVKPPDPR